MDQKLQNLSFQIEKLASQGPFFIYDLDGLQAHALTLKQSGLTLWYACKANPLGAILKVLKEAQFCFDVASIGELQQVLTNGIQGGQILVTGPAKSERFLRIALENQVETFVIESPNQLQLLESLAKEYSYQPKILLRLQLTWEEGEGTSILGGHEITAFGMDLATAQRLVKQMKLPFLGFHVFQWANILSADRLSHIWQQTVNVCKSLIEQFDVLDVGGGLGIPYCNETPLSWPEIVAKINAIKNSNNIKTFWLELGRYVTGPYGCYITKVIDRKKTYGKEILVLEGGINHIARSSLINESFPAGLFRNSTSPLEKFSLHGPLCTSLDFLGDHYLPADVDSNDIIIFYQAGAYGFTESMPFFLCHQLPGEAIIQNQEIIIVREPENASHWLK